MSTWWAFLPVYPQLRCWRLVMCPARLQAKIGWAKLGQRWRPEDGFGLARHTWKPKQAAQAAALDTFNGQLEVIYIQLINSYVCNLHFSKNPHFGKFQYHCFVSCCDMISCTSFSLTPQSDNYPSSKLTILLSTGNTNKCKTYKEGKSTQLLPKC